MVPTADRGVIALTSGGGARRAHRNRDSWRYSDSAVTDESVATRAIALPRTRFSVRTRLSAQPKPVAHRAASRRGPGRRRRRPRRPVRSEVADPLR